MELLICLKDLKLNGIMKFRSTKDIEINIESEWIQGGEIKFTFMNKLQIAKNSMVDTIHLNKEFVKRLLKDGSLVPITKVEETKLLNYVVRKKHIRSKMEKSMFPEGDMFDDE